MINLNKNKVISNLKFEKKTYSEKDMIEFSQIYLSKRYDNPRMSNKDIFNFWKSKK